MKIGLINDQPKESGMGKYAYYLHNLLINKFDIDYIYLNFEKRTIERERNGKKEILGRLITIPFEKKPFFLIRLREAIPRGYNLNHFLTQNLSFLVKDKISVVTCHDLAPLITSTNIFERILRKYLYHGLKKATKIITDSVFTANELKRIYGIPSDKVLVINLGVDHNIFRPIDKEESRKILGLPMDKDIILHIGAEQPRKNVDGLINAFSLLENKNTKVILIRVGKMSRRVKNLILKLGLMDKVYYYTNIAEEELPYFYGAADLFVFPSYYEGFGLPPLEAMASGCPVIASNATSIPEVVGDAAVLTEPCDVHGIAENMFKVISDNGLREDLIQKGLERAKLFTWKKAAEKTLKYYKEILR